jgi:uncharacterized membrane protein YcaP (DUF421 family)
MLEDQNQVECVPVLATIVFAGYIPPQGLAREERLLCDEEFSPMEIDWKAIFVPTTSILEIMLRGTFVYLFLFILLRIMRREAGAIGLADLLVVVLIADAAQNALGSDYKSITEGAILVSTIVFWDYLLDWLGYRVPSIRRLLRPAPLPLIKEGRLMKRNMRQEMITVEELMAQLREQGIDDVKKVKICSLEGDGRISVIRVESNPDEQRKQRRPGPQ